MPFTTESTCQTFVNNLFEAPAGQNVGLTGYVCVGDGVDNKVGHHLLLLPLFHSDSVISRAHALVILEVLSL